MSAGERLVGAGAVLMALCCALLPLAGAALGGGLIAGTGRIGIVVGTLVLVAVGVVVGRRRRSRRC
jgi:hypothetical protein